MQNSDYTSHSSTVAFPSGSTDNTPGCVNISITDDSALEGNEVFTVTLDTLDPDVLLGNNVTVITLEDNDSMSVNVITMAT